MGLWGKEISSRVVLYGTRWGRTGSVKEECAVDKQQRARQAVEKCAMGYRDDCRKTRYILICIWITCVIYQYLPDPCPYLQVVVYVAVTAICRDLDTLSEFFEYKRIWDFENIWMDMGVSHEVLHGLGWSYRQNLSIWLRLSSRAICSGCYLVCAELYTQQRRGAEKSCVVCCSMNTAQMKTIKEAEIIHFMRGMCCSIDIFDMTYGLWCNPK
jgi:hypothetical protein